MMMCDTNNNVDDDRPITVSSHESPAVLSPRSVPTPSTGTTGNEMITSPMSCTSSPMSITTMVPNTTGLGGGGGGPGQLNNSYDDLNNNIPVTVNFVTANATDTTGIGSIGLNTATTPNMTNSSGHGNNNNNNKSGNAPNIVLPDIVLESLHKSEHFPPSRHRWNTNEEIAALLISIDQHEKWLSEEVKLRPKSGSMLLYSRKRVRYRRDGYCWKKRKDGKTTREDHMKLKVQGIECIYGCYVHSAILPTFHRRCYWLLQNPDVVLVHYLNVPYNNDDNKIVSPSLHLLLDTRKEWTREDLITELRPMFYSVNDNDTELDDELEKSTLDTIESIVQQLLVRQRQRLKMLDEPTGGCQQDGNNMNCGSTTATSVGIRLGSGNCQTKTSNHEHGKNYPSPLSVPTGTNNNGYLASQQQQQPTIIKSQAHQIFTSLSSGQIVEAANVAGARRLSATTTGGHTAGAMVPLKRDASTNSDMVDVNGNCIHHRSSSATETRNSQQQQQPTNTVQLVQLTSTVNGMCQINDTSGGGATGENCGGQNATTKTASTSSAAAAALRQGTSPTSLIFNMSHIQSSFIILNNSTTTSVSSANHQTTGSEIPGTGDSHPTPAPPIAFVTYRRPGSDPEHVDDSFSTTAKLLCNQPVSTAVGHRHTPSASSCSSSSSSSLAFKVPINVGISSEFPNGKSTNNSNSQIFAAALASANTNTKNSVMTPIFAASTSPSMSSSSVLVDHGRTNNNKQQNLNGTLANEDISMTVNEIEMDALTDIEARTFNLEDEESMLICSSASTPERIINQHHHHHHHHHSNNINLATSTHFIPSDLKLLLDDSREKPDPTNHNPADFVDAFDCSMFDENEQSLMNCIRVQNSTSMCKSNHLLRDSIMPLVANQATLYSNHQDDGSNRITLVHNGFISSNGGGNAHGNSGGQQLHLNQHEMNLNLLNQTINCKVNNGARDSAGHGSGKDTDLMNESHHESFDASQAIDFMDHEDIPTSDEILFNLETFDMFGEFDNLEDDTCSNTTNDLAGAVSHTNQSNQVNEADNYETTKNSNNTSNVGGGSKQPNNTASTNVNANGATLPSSSSSSSASYPQSLSTQTETTTSFLVNNNNGVPANVIPGWPDSSRTTNADFLIEPSNGSGRNQTSGTSHNDPGRKCMLSAMGGHDNNNDNPSDSDLIMSARNNESNGGTTTAIDHFERSATSTTSIDVTVDENGNLSITKTRRASGHAGQPPSTMSQNYPLLKRQLSSASLLMQNAKNGKEDQTIIAELVNGRSQQRQSSNSSNPASTSTGSGTSDTSSHQSYLVVRTSPDDSLDRGENSIECKQQLTTNSGSDKINNGNDDDPVPTTTATTMATRRFYSRSAGTLSSSSGSGGGPLYQRTPAHHGDTTTNDHQERTVHQNSEPRTNDGGSSLHITDYSPEWCYTEGGIKVLVAGPWHDNSKRYAILFDNIAVPTQLVQNGLLRCFSPKHEPGLVTIRVSCNDVIVSNSVIFEYRSYSPGTKMDGTYFTANESNALRLSIHLDSINQNSQHSPLLYKQHSSLETKTELTDDDFNESAESH